MDTDAALVVHADGSLALFGRVLDLTLEERVKLALCHRKMRHWPPEAPREED